MRFINLLLGQTQEDEGKLKLKFNKRDNIWQVLKGKSIVCMGEEVLCRRYLRNYTLG